MKTDSDSENKFPPWLLSGLADAAPCPAALALGAEGDGATLFAERLALKFAGAEDAALEPAKLPGHFGGASGPAEVQAGGGKNALRRGRGARRR